MCLLGFQFSLLSSHQKPTIVELHHKPCIPFCIFASGSATVIQCSLRKRPKNSLWRSRLLYSEAIQAVHALKLARTDPQLEVVFATRVCRLLKRDLLSTLTELQRQNQLDLALLVFKYVREEVWYKPELLLYCNMIRLLGKNKKIDMVEDMFLSLKNEGLKPDTRVYTEMIGAFLQVGMIEKALETYGSMKTSGCVPDELTFTILIRNLENAKEDELAMAMKKECAEYVEHPEEFLQEVARKLRKRELLHV